MKGGAAVEGTDNKEDSQLSPSAAAAADAAAAAEGGLSTAQRAAIGTTAAAVFGVLGYVGVRAIVNNQTTVVAKLSKIQGALTSVGTPASEKAVKLIKNIQNQPAPVKRALAGALIVILVGMVTAGGVTAWKEHKAEKAAKAAELGKENTGEGIVETGDNDTSSA